MPEMQVNSGHQFCPDRNSPKIMVPFPHGTDLRRNALSLTHMNIIRFTAPELLATRLQGYHAHN